ncbi:hypothetical protein [Nonomuraea sp. 10N515B]|uniref:hypothetical protein n=1 Tax=Nonomuraea sp. 10N515B TaxID=3457422 RepID=UPI003FCC4E54
MIADALAGRRRGLPEVWRRALSSGVGRLGHEAVRPLAAPGHSIAPGLPSVRWRPAAERPARWLHGYAGAVADVWKSAESLWRRACPLLDREVERVGVATVRGGPELLLASLTSRIVYGERGLLIPGTERDRHEPGNRKIVLVPMLAGKDALIVGLDDPEAVWIAYPVPGADSLWRRPVAPAMGLTYHCDRLRAGRLITRERRGREVWIARTGRAEELLELFRR